MESIDVWWRLLMTARERLRKPLLYPLSYGTKLFIINELQWLRMRRIDTYLSTAKKSSTGGMVRIGAGLYKRGKHGVYYARIKRNDKDTWKSLKTTNFAVAKAELANLT